MKGICKKAKKEGEKLRNEINQSPLNLNGVFNSIFVLKKPPHINDVIFNLLLDSEVIIDK
jgi:hypothetical protein